jgi:hypothetical protein
MAKCSWQRFMTLGGAKTWKKLRPIRDHLQRGPWRGLGSALEIYWGLAFRNVNREEEGLQDDGVHFALDMRLF